MSGGPKRFCGHCGAGLNPGLRFCESCGTPVQGSEAPGAAPSRSRSAVSGVAPTMVADLSQPPPAAKVVRPTVPLTSTPGVSIPGPPGPGPSLPGSSLPSASLPGSSYGAPPAMVPATPKRRWWAAVPLLLVVAIVVGGAVAWFGFPLQTRRLLAQRGLRTGVGKSRVAGFPASRSDEPPRFRRRLVEAPDAPPGDVALATPVYLVEARGASHGPYEISLPLLHAASRRRVVVAQHVDGHWRALPTARDGDHVIASTDGFGTFAGWTVRRRPRPTEAERARLVVPTPRLLFARLEGDQLSFHLDIRGLDTATSPDSAWSDRVAVRGLHVEVARPAAGAAEAAESAFGPYPVEGGDLLWSPGQAVGIIPIALSAVDASVGADTPVRHRAWLLRVHPVFEDGTTGPPTDAVPIYPELVRAYAQMIRQLPWPDGPRQAFLANTAQHPLTVGIGESFADNGYRDALAWTRQRSWGWIRAGFTGPQITMVPEATFGDVATHAFGHYATHMALGDDYVDALSGERHGWVASSREAAFNEDLATVLGQLATGTAVPNAAGPMLGHPEDLARHPPADLANAWPANRTQDALAVETVPATVMSRLASDLGAETVTGALLSSHATELLELIDALPSASRETARRVMMDEGISWTMRGQVMSDGTPVAGAVVRVQNDDGHAFQVPTADRDTAMATTDDTGSFTVRVPYGAVQLVAAAPGLRQVGGPRAVQATASRSTASEPESLEPLTMERAGPAVTIRRPRAGAVLRARTVTVEGTVAPDSVERVVLHTGGQEVQVTASGGQFSGRVVLRPGANTITAAAAAPDGEGSATVAIEANVPAARLVAQLTWDRSDADLDLSVRAPGAPRALPRALDSDGFGPELTVYAGDAVGTFPVSVRHRSGGPASFTVRWCVNEGQPAERCGEERGRLTGAGTSADFEVHLP